MCFSKQAIEIVPNLKEKQTEIEKIILQQSPIVLKSIPAHRSLIASKEISTSCGWLLTNGPPLRRSITFEVLS